MSDERAMTMIWSVRCGCSLNRCTRTSPRSRTIDGRTRTSHLPPRDLGAAPSGRSRLGPLGPRTSQRAGASGALGRDHGIVGSSISHLAVYVSVGPAGVIFGFTFRD